MEKYSAIGKGIQGQFERWLRTDLTTEEKDKLIWAWRRTAEATPHRPTGTDLVMPDNWVKVAEEGASAEGSGMGIGAELGGVTGGERTVSGDRERQPPPGLVHHSDRGLQYCCLEYVQLLHSYGILPSMSRPANPYDNAFCESFMRTLKREQIYANVYRDLEDLRTHIEQFIEQYYNRCRLHSALGYRSPQEFEQMAGNKNTAWLAESVQPE